MIFQIGVDIKNPCGDEVWEYVKGEGNTWEVVAGMPMQERIFNNVSTLYRFMQECENIYDGNLDFTMSPYPKNTEEDTDMIYMIISDAKK